MTHPIVGVCLFDEESGVIIRHVAWREPENRAEMSFAEYAEQYIKPALEALQEPRG